MMMVTGLDYYYVLCISDDQQEQQTWSGSGQTLYK